MLLSLLPNEVKMNFIFADIRLRSSLTTVETLEITKWSFFYYIIRFYPITLRSFERSFIRTRSESPGFELNRETY